MVFKDCKVVSFFKEAVQRVADPSVQRHFKRVRLSPVAIFITCRSITCIINLVSKGKFLVWPRSASTNGKLVSMIFRHLLFLLMPLLWHWRSNASEDGSGMNSEITTIKLDPVIWNASVTTQSQLDQFMENVTAYNDRRNTSYLHLSLAGETNSYTLDIVKLMNISLTNGGSLILESKGGSAEIDCTASQSDLKELKEVVQPISRASLVLMDGLVFTGCPVPIMIEEASNVTIRNCVFR